MAAHGTDRLRSVEFAAAVPPYLLHTHDNPEGSLAKSEAAKMAAALTANRDTFYGEFTTTFLSANGKLMVSEEQRQDRSRCASRPTKNAALQCQAAFARPTSATTCGRSPCPLGDPRGRRRDRPVRGFRPPRTHNAIPGSELVVINGGPYGINVSHEAQFNQALLDFLAP